SSILFIQHPLHLRYLLSFPTRRSSDLVIFTSGTTAEPRGVVISHGNILANIERLELEIHKYLRYERLVHPLRFLNLLPLSHVFRSEEHTSELQSRFDLVCRLLLEKKNK